MDEEPRFCKLGACGELLVRKAGETRQNWEAREFCNRSCAASHTFSRKSKKQKLAVFRVFGARLN